MNYSNLLLLYARNGLFRSLRKSAFRKFCRVNRGHSLIAKCRNGFFMNTTIGDSVDNQIFVYGALEEGTTHIIGSLAPQCGSFLDVGCNIGYYSCLFGTKNPSKPLFPIDPNPIMIKRTEENLKLNKIANYQLLNYGIGKEPATLKFNIPQFRHSLSSFAYIPRKGGPIESIDAQIKTLDEVISENAIAASLVKIDTEGFEYSVFCGLSESMIDRIWFIVFELSGSNLQQAGNSPTDILSLPIMEKFDMYIARNEEGGFIEKVSSESLMKTKHINANILLVRKNEKSIKALQQSGIHRR